MPTITSTVLETILEQLLPSYQLLLENFLKNIDVKATSKSTYRRSLLQFFLFLEDNEIHFNNCQRSTIIEYKNHLLEQVQVNKFSLLTADNYLNAVKVFFKWAFINDELPNLNKNITEGISINAEYEGFKKEALTSNQVQLLLENIHESIALAKRNDYQLSALRNYAMIYLMVSSGVRSITTTRIRIEDIALKHGTPIIYVQRKGRNSKDDFIILEAAPYKAIFEYLIARFEVETLEQLSIEQQQMPLFSSHSNRNNGQVLTPDRIRQVVKKHLRQIGLNNKVFSAHSLRHTYGTLQLQLSGDIFQVAENMGHKNLKSTKKYTAKERQRQRINNYTNISQLFDKDSK